MNNDTLKRVLEIIQDAGFALIVIQPEGNKAQHWSYTVGLCSVEGLDCELVFPECYTPQVCADIANGIIELAKTHQVQFNSILNIPGCTLILKKYEPEEYLVYPLSLANEYFSVLVPAIKVSLISADLST